MTGSCVWRIIPCPICCLTSFLLPPPTSPSHNAYVHNAAMSFRVHHYVGSWETFRQPGFDARGKGHFNKRNGVKNVVADNTTPRYSSSYNGTWLTEFTKLVGKEKALELTQSIRIREELEMDRVMRELENGKQMYD